MIEDILAHFKERYPGVFLMVTQRCCLSAETGKVGIEWNFWHSGAAQVVGPCPTAAALVKAVNAWEASGERKLAEGLHAQKKADDARLEAMRNARERPPTHDGLAPDEQGIDLTTCAADHEHGGEG